MKTITILPSFMVSIIIGFSTVLGWEFKEKSLEKCYEGGSGVESMRIECEKGNLIGIVRAFYATFSYLEQNKIDGYVNEVLNRSSCTVNNSSVVSPCKQDLRIITNNKCGERDFCRFNINEDVKNLKCLKKGKVVFNYHCLDRSKMNRFCNEEMIEREGFIHSPGYPIYYPNTSCHWTIKSLPGQKINLDILDLSLKLTTAESNITIPDSYEPSCSHYLKISNGHKVLLQVCGQSEKKLASFSVSTGQLVLSLHSNNRWMDRGFLARYKIDGCPTVQAPENGLVEHEDENEIKLKCYLDYIFADSLDNVRVLKCIDRFQWEPKIAQCERIDEVVDRKNISINFLLRFKSSKVRNHEKHTNQDSLVYDVIIPSTLIGVMVVVNIPIVLILIYNRGKLKKKLLSDEEESLHESNVCKQLSERQHNREASTSITTTSTAYGH